MNGLDECLPPQQYRLRRGSSRTTGGADTESDHRDPEATDLPGAEIKASNMTEKRTEEKRSQIKMFNFL
jgi:hypothetical protein